MPFDAPLLDGRHKIIGKTVQTIDMLFNRVQVSCSEQNLENMSVSHVPFVFEQPGTTCLPSEKETVDQPMLVWKL